jgi:hypothetical protein
VAMAGTSEAVPPLVVREFCAVDGRLFDFVDLAADPQAPPTASDSSQVSVGAPSSGG